MPDKMLYKWLQQSKNPLGVVNFCFLVVLLFSTLLMWREAVVLESAYMDNQRNQINTVMTALDRQLQYNIDELLFLRNSMQTALAVPVSERTNQAMHNLQQLQTLPFWQLARPFNQRQPLPINGVGKVFLNRYPWLIRDGDELNREISAVLDFSYILKLAGSRDGLEHLTQYTSRAGFFVAGEQTANNREIITRYQRLIERPYFSRHNDRDNPSREIIWSDFSESDGESHTRLINVSVPVDYHNRWFGVLSIDFTPQAMRHFLKESLETPQDGTVILYSPAFDVIAASAPENERLPLFNERQKADVQKAMQNANEGNMRMTTHFISWSRLHNYDGVLVRVHSLREGIAGEYGTITIVLTLLWVVSTLMLLGSWYVIRKLMMQMMNMQRKLRWRANYDELTRVYSRGAFFEQAYHQAKECQLQGQPYSLIQMDLDHFKQINDTWGHEAGDKVLMHTGAMLLAALREQDIAGRVGGEEFCILLPGTGRIDAARVAERIRERLNAREILIRPGQTLKIHASFGISSSDEQQVYAIDRLQSIADDRLYKAKDAGRNCICWE